jgi:hypothetical protein
MALLFLHAFYVTLFRYIRAHIHVSSLTPMSDFQSSVRLLAPLLWLRCDADPSTCGLSRVGSVRIRQWRRVPSANYPCFSSSEFISRCLSSDSNSANDPTPHLSAAAAGMNGSAAVGSDGEVVLLLGSSTADEVLWDDLFKPSSLFFTAETARIEIAGTFFSPKHRHFVSFEISAVLDGGFSQSRSHHRPQRPHVSISHAFVVIECLISRISIFPLQEQLYAQLFLPSRSWPACGIF